LLANKFLENKLFSGVDNYMNLFHQWHLSPDGQVELDAVQDVAGMPA
jgi:hypothetical protein